MPKICLVLVFLTMILTVGSADTPIAVDDIREAVYRHQMTRWNASLYFLALGINRKGEFVGPPTTFMQRFLGQSNVKRSEDLLLQDESSVILCIDHVRLKGDSEAEVSARFVPSSLTKSSSGFYTVRLQKNGRWMVTNTSRFKVIPLQ
jgi:hypothetical protein